SARSAHGGSWRPCHGRRADRAAAGHPVRGRPSPSTRLAYWADVVLSRGWAVFLTAVGVWTWAIWPRFAVAIWNDPRSWSTGEVAHGSPTGFLWVHALLTAASLAIGAAVGVLGARGWRAARGAAAADGCSLPSRRSSRPAARAAVAGSRRRQGLRSSTRRSRSPAGSTGALSTPMESAREAYLCGSCCRVAGLDEPHRGR